MKKYIALASAFALALTFTACHDDDDDDDSKAYIADYTTINQVSYIPGVQSAVGKAGLNAFMLSDANGYTDVTCYMVADTTEITENMQMTEEMFENFYGGICPTAFKADDETYDYFRPACGTYHSGTGALVSNNGSLCRSLFTRRHFAASMTSIGSLFLGDADSLWVCPTAAYNYLTTEEGRTALGVTTSPKNIEIRFVVYGYVKSLSLGSWKTLVEMMTTNIKSASGTKCSSYAVLAKTDASGNWTVNKDWQKIDLDDIDHYYVFEAALEVVDATTGKQVSTFTLEDYGENQNGLNYCMIDDITLESKSLF